MTVRWKKSYRRIYLGHGVLPFHMLTAIKIPSSTEYMYGSEVKWRTAAARTDGSTAPRQAVRDQQQGSEKPAEHRQYIQSNK